MLFLHTYIDTSFFATTCPILLTITIYTIQIPATFVVRSATFPLRLANAMNTRGQAATKAHSIHGPCLEHVLVYNYITNQ